MNCHELNRILETKDASDLGVTEKGEIERHFASCTNCRRAWASFAEIAAEPIPAISPELHSRIDQLIAARLPGRATSARRAFIGGGLLVLGAAAAAIVLQAGGRDEELVADPDPRPPATGSLRPNEGDETSLAQITASDVAGTESADSISGVAPIPASYALDPRSVVVIADAGSNADADALETFNECQRGVVARLRGIPGLNVISGAAVTAYQATGMANEQIARELGAGSVLVLDDFGACNFKLSDSGTGAFIAGQVLATALVTIEGALTLDTDNVDWGHFYDGLARTVNDALLMDEAALVANAQSAFLNTSLGEEERLVALRRASPSIGSLPDSLFSPTVVYALVQMMTTSTDPQIRRSAVLAVRGLDDATLIEPLLQALSHDPESAVRTVAASTLHEYVDEPRVRDALRNVIDENPDDDPSTICCEGSLGEAARRALASDDELRALSLQQLMNAELTDSQRLEPLISYPDRDTMYVYKPDEAQSNVVFSIGRDSDDPAVRSNAWSVLARGARNPAYVPTLLDDLSAHGVEEVRHAAAQVLTQYADDPGVRTALERALEADSCECLSSILEPVLQAE